MKRASRNAFCSSPLPSPSYTRDRHRQSRHRTFAEQRKWASVRSPTRERVAEFRDGRLIVHGSWRSRKKKKSAIVNRTSALSRPAHAQTRNGKKLALWMGVWMGADSSDTEVRKKFVSTSTTKVCAPTIFRVRGTRSTRAHRACARRRPIGPEARRAPSRTGQRARRQNRPTGDPHRSAPPRGARR